MKPILITGATGFCGKHLFDYLQSRGWEVQGTGTNPKKIKETPGFLNLDIRNAQEVESLLKRLKPAAVFHLAAQSVPRISWEDPDRTFKTNVEGTILLLRALMRHTPNARFILASTSYVYGRTFLSNPRPSESAPVWPENPYAFSKLAAELACLNFHSRFGLQTVIARSVNFLGENQRTDLVFADWCRQIAMAEIGKRPPFLEVGNLDVRRDFLHVEDGVKAYEALLQEAKPGEIYNLSTMQSKPLRHYANFLIDKSLIPLQIRAVKNKMRRAEAPSIEPDNGKLKSLGWRPEKTPESALEQLLNSWRNLCRKNPKLSLV